MSLSKRYREHVKKADFHPDPAQEAVIERLQALSHSLQSYRPGRRGGFLGRFGGTTPPPKGLYIFGKVGRGKSMLMDLFFEETHFRPKRRVHFHSFMLEVHRAIAMWRKLSPRERAKQPNFVREAGDDPIAPVARAIARSAMLLCFDEFQVTDIADAMILGRLFEALFKDGVVVVATSNRAPETLYEGGLNRQLFLPFIDLVRDKLDTACLDGPRDYRLDRLAGALVYYSPLAPETDRAMDEMWQRVTKGALSQPQHLDVQGRILAVPLAALGAARFEFADLAQRPLGAADYLEIAYAYHTVFVDHIPRMAKEQRNEAKRFVTLIDALYEIRVKLVCSADAPPEELFAEGGGSFEFQRAASRLREMQSESYLALGHGASDAPSDAESPPV